MERIEAQRAARETKLQKYREELSKVENMLETSKNDLFHLKNDLMRQRDEQEEQLKAEVTRIDEDLGKTVR